MNETEPPNGLIQSTTQLPFSK